MKIALRFTPIEFPAHPATWRFGISLAVAVVWLAVNSNSLAQSELSPQVRADILRGQLTEAYEAGDHKRVLVLIGEYKRIKGVEIPVPLFYAEANAAYATRDYLRALSSLDRYLHRTDKSSVQYSDAIRIYPAVREAANKQSGGLVNVLAQIAGDWRHWTPEGLSSNRPPRSEYECDATRNTYAAIQIRADDWDQTKSYGDKPDIIIQYPRPPRAAYDAVYFCKFNLVLDSVEPLKLSLHALTAIGYNHGEWCREGKVAYLTGREKDSSGAYTALHLRGQFFANAPPDVCNPATEFTLSRNSIH